MANILDNLGDLGGMGADALLTLLSTVIDAIGEGTEFTGQQIERLGELSQQLADKVAALRPGAGG